MSDETICDVREEIRTREQYVSIKWLWIVNCFPWNHAFFRKIYEIVQLIVNSSDVIDYY